MTHWIITLDAYNLGKSPCLSVPNHIQQPPYVSSRQRPGMNNGPEIHDEQGIECMRASGKLAAQVLKFAGTLVKVMLLLLQILNCSF